MRRDGDRCFYCHLRLSVETATIEHLQNRGHGGNNKIDNLVLACPECNQARNHAETKGGAFSERSEAP